MTSPNPKLPMKPLLLCVLTALLPFSLHGAEHISVEARFIEGKSSRALPHDLKHLNELRGVDIVTAPHITTRSGHEMRVEVARNSRARQLRDLQTVTLRVTPHHTRKGIAYVAHASIGPSASSPLREPAASASTAREIHASGTSRAGEEVWLDFPTRDGNAASVLLIFQRKKTS